MQSSKAPRPIFMMDWDNTAMASAKAFREVLLLTAAELKAKQPPIDLIETIPVIATKSHNELVKALWGEKNFDAAKPIFQKHYDKIFSPELLSNLQMLPGAKQLISKLLDANHPPIIISSHYGKRPGKEDGIEDHLIRKGFTAKQISTIGQVALCQGQQKQDPKIKIIGVDTLDANGLSQKEHGKPNITCGLLALELAGIDLKKEPVKILYWGDGKTDVQFGDALDVEVKKQHPGSSCRTLLFNSVLEDGPQGLRGILREEPIFSAEELATFMKEMKSADSKDLHSNRVVRGYGKLFFEARQMIAPLDITSEMLEKKKRELKSVGLKSKL